MPEILYSTRLDEGSIMAINQLEPEDNYKYLSFYAEIDKEMKVYLIYVRHSLYVQLIQK